MAGRTHRRGWLLLCPYNIILMTFFRLLLHGILVPMNSHEMTAEFNECNVTHHHLLYYFIIFIVIFCIGWLDGSSYPPPPPLPPIFFLSSLLRNPFSICLIQSEDLFTLLNNPELTFMVNWVYSMAHSLIRSLARFLIETTRKRQYQGIINADTRMCVCVCKCFKGPATQIFLFHNES